MPRVIYRGEPQCPCLVVLEEWYRKDPFQVQPNAQVQCDCGQYWIFRTARDGLTTSWEWDESLNVKW